MPKVFGKIGSLTEIRKILDEQGVNRFNSIREIKSFLKNFEDIKEEMFFTAERDFDLEIDLLQAKTYDLQKEHDNLKRAVITVLNNRKKELVWKQKALKSKMPEKPLKKAICWFKLKYTRVLKYLIVKNHRYVIRLQTKSSYERLNSNLKKLNHLSNNRKDLISQNCDPKFKTLEHENRVACSLLPMIAGAIGESLVEKELLKLPENVVLFNDFKLEFEKPLYQKKDDQYIYSVQIDHLVLTHAGLFVIETKNWSKNSIQNKDLFSPVKQIQRSNYALFSLLNSANDDHPNLIKDHHWGQKRIPIRNIVVLINHKPKQEFNYVKILTLKELNSYINYFEPTLHDTELNKITDYLNNINT
ncbi:nuclease-related domain-containing protein [Gaetbulibacter sp. M240]|uniref:nuclease-related domain-containing protein n=1 Tax=Gaetbulibacter sp. M240 TaxID=3126511 RepID=UPI00374F25C0